RYGRSILSGLPSIFVKTVIGTVVMAVVAGGALMIMQKMPFGPGYDIVRLAIVVPLSALVYVLAAKLLRNEMFSLILPARKS
ncbi:MAG: hypothetical protein J7M40_14435, partial [Planctomycetes bacterium]|nr:hypothetical protein [Planctomycetota bacterium]